MLLVTLPLPHKLLHPNSRPHYMAKAKLTKKARQDAVWAGACAMRDADMSRPFVGQAKVTLTFYFLDNRTRDKDGLVAQVKAYLDGLADSGIVKNDSQFEVDPPEIKVVTRDQRLEVRIYGVFA